MKKMTKSIRKFLHLGVKYSESAVILAVLLYVVSRFYIATDRNFFESTAVTASVILGIIYISLLTDGLYLALHLPRRPVKHKNLKYDPTKLTILIACYNGENVIAETIENALKQVAPQNIIVASDASKDKTVEIARSYGVKVFDYKTNVNKAFTISRAIKHVETPYVLILDDDTMIGDTFIPTSLLDDGYSAVAFNVMPVKTNALVNYYQMYEYRKSMFYGKSLRGSVGGVGNVSGAIGLYHTKDLVEQAETHSGQYGGEDQQRTMLVQMKGHGKGVTYTDSSVYTKVPNTFRALTKQRAKSWNLSCQELFIIYTRVLFSPNVDYILKVDRAYQMYVVLTDPIRMVFIWTFLFHPLASLISYVYYVLLGIITWLKLGAKDPIWVVLTFPFYNIYQAFCRFHAYFHWYRVKYRYIFQKKYHKYVPGRNLLAEYAFIGLIFLFVWSLTFRVILANIPDNIKF
jgi:cellulose synthase/poly-beta-1,6-N-acetylglucosamine synthase-like glycosyltransferase